jgi:GNAT superfamily N-acetyltransferase
MEYKIRIASEKDFPDILKLIRELAEFERAPEKVTNTVEKMQAEQGLFTCIVAVNKNDEIIGMALWFYAYFTWVGKSLYLDDIYVKEEYRKHRIGSALLKKVFETAVKENCKRVRWQVLKWNENAIKLYSKSGAKIDGEWLNCDFNEEEIKNFRL